MNNELLGKQRGYFEFKLYFVFCTLQARLAGLEVMINFCFFSIFSEKKPAGLLSYINTIKV